MRVTVVSGSRADYGPLQPLLAGLRDDPRFDLTVVATGGHLDPRQGRTLDAFAADGFTVDETVDLGLAGTDPLTVVAATGRAVAGVGAALARLRPDLVVLLGDRSEILAAATAAHLLRLPIAHLSGGDVTSGSLDDAMRHAITKLAHLHLPTNAAAAARLRAMGEPAGRIVTVGSTALDALTAFTPLDRTALGARLGVTLSPVVVAVAYHAATLADEPSGPTMTLLLGAVASVAPEATVVVTGSNADEGGADVDAAAQRAAAADPRVVTVPSLGREGFWSLLHHASVLVGNSSSALIEAPLTGVSVVDVGSRQAGRLRDPETLHAPAEPGALRSALTEALGRPRRPRPSPYGDGHAVPRVLEALAAVDPGTLLRRPPPGGEDL